MCIYFSHWRVHWCFLDVIDWQGLDLCLVALPLIVEDCWKLQHYCLDIIGNFRFRFINCNDWTMIFFQFKFSLTILPVCTIRQSVVTDSVTYEQAAHHPFKHFRNYPDSPCYLKEGNFVSSWREVTAPNFRRWRTTIYTKKPLRSEGQNRDICTAPPQTFLT